MRLSPSIVLLRTQTDERLVELAGEGSEAAFTALVERYRRLVLRACMRVLPEARADDATQQVFISAWNALRRGDEVHAVRPWLLKIARNTALNALRTPGFEYDELAESLQGGSAPQAELERRDVMRQTLRGLAALPENQREALLRTAVQGASHADIARDLGISEGATRQLVLRARATLRAGVSALIPLPLLHWAAKAHGLAVAEAAAGGSSAGVAALAKAGAVVVLAGGAATPVIVHEAHRRHRPATTQTTVAAVRATSAAEPAATPAPEGSAVATTTAVALSKGRGEAKAVPARRRKGTKPRRVRGRGHRARVGTGASGTANTGPGGGATVVAGNGNGKETRPQSEPGPGNSGNHTGITANPGKGKNKNKHSGSDTAGGNGHGNKDEPAKPTPTPKPERTPEPEPTEPPDTPSPQPTPTAEDQSDLPHGHDRNIRTSH